MASDEKSRIRAGSRTISQRYRSADPDLYRNILDPEHCFKAVHFVVDYKNIYP
jgi:hypothetical protein